MKRTTGILSLALMAVLLVMSASSAEDKSDLAALQGTWKGREIGNDANSSCRLIIAGKNIDYRGVDANDWVKGTLTLKEGAKPQQLSATITECANSEQIGKVSLVIYKIENGVLTLAGNAPGNANVPESFDAPGARHFEFKKE